MSSKIIANNSVHSLIHVVIINDSSIIGAPMKIFIVSIRTIALDKGISEGPGCRKVVALNSYLIVDITWCFIKFPFLPFIPHNYLLITHTWATFSLLPFFFITQCLLFHILNLDP